MIRKRMSQDLNKGTKRNFFIYQDTDLELLAVLHLDAVPEPGDAGLWICHDRAVEDEGWGVPVSVLDRRLSGESGGDAIDLTIKGEQDDSDATGEKIMSSQNLFATNKAQKHSLLHNWNYKKEFMQWPDGCTIPILAIFVLHIFLNSYEYIEYCTSSFYFLALTA